MQPNAQSALRALDILVGDWTIDIGSTDGWIYNNVGHTTFDWHDSRAHLVQNTVITKGNIPNSNAIIGCDGTAGTYALLYADERGASRIYQMTFGSGTWTQTRVGDPFPQRFVAFFEDDNTIRACWEKAEDGERFDVDFYLTYRRETSIDVAPQY